MKIDEYIEKEEKIISKKINEIDTLKKIIEKYPDMETHIDRWNNQKFVSKLVNPEVDNCYFSHSCGCCDDAALFVWSYKKIGDFELFSNPPNITIGEGNPSYRYDDFYDEEEDKSFLEYSEIAYSHWENNLKQKNISDCVIEKTRKYLIENAGWEGDE